MRIVIDMQGAQSESRFRGIGRYTLSLTQAIVRNQCAHEVILALNGLFHDTIEPIRAIFNGLLPQENICVWYAPGPVKESEPGNEWRRQVAERIRESFLASLQPDIVYVSSLFEGFVDDAITSIGVFTSQIPTVVTLYDLIPLLSPESYLTPNPRYEQYYQLKIGHLKRASRWLAISESAASEGRSTLALPTDRVVNISTACDSVFRRLEITETEKQKFLRRFGITKPFILYTGGADPRKNLQRLIRAYMGLSETLRNAYHLVMAGKMSEGEVFTLKQIAETPGIPKDFLLFTGYVTDEELTYFCNLCEVFVLPSCHEGFGLPALEAMSCGAAVIGSSTSSVPEVIGYQDALFDPYDEASISHKLSEVLENDRFRTMLKAHGLEQAKKFSWDDSAQRTLAAFERLHENNPVHRPYYWHSITAELEKGYSRLIEAISEVPVPTGSLDDNELMITANCIARNEQLTDRIVRSNPLPETVKWRIEGPFDSSYSLALLNRETARTLDLVGHHVALHSTEGHGDFPPDSDFLYSNPDIARLYERAQEFSSTDADVTSRNLYPPRVADMDCRMNLMHHFAWEESGFPREWVESFNKHLQGITCLSQHVKKILVDHGVTVPMSVSGCGVDHWERIKSDNYYNLKARTFRFLHVSSCFPRKGADLLLKAFGKVFESRDDVTLVIKTFPNPHNKIHQWLADAQAERCNFPDVQIIEDDLTDAQLKSLYEQCHVMVAPSRAEGFGLPMAEAMLSGLAVITTNWSGQLDFCNAETAWLVDYTFKPAQTHFGLFDTVWAEPDLDHLARIIREVYDMPEALRKKRVERGKLLLLEDFRWSNVATRLVNSARSWSKIPVLPTPRIGWVTTWNTRCGIATYSTHLVDNMLDNITIFASRTEQFTQLDGAGVVRCWNAGEEDALNELAEQINIHKIDTCVVQFNYGFFNLEHFGRFLTGQINAGRTVVLMMHSTTDPANVPDKKLEKLKEALSQCHRILVHAPGDLNRLKAVGLIENVSLFPHGILDYTPPSVTNPKTSITSKDNGFIIASYGFFLPHKGLLELIEAISLLRHDGQEVRLRMINAEYPVPESAALIQKAKEKISMLGLSDKIQLITDFLPDDKSLSLLAIADLIVFPYQNTGESASGAVRYGLATGRPVAVTPLSIFDDIVPAVYTLPGQTPHHIAQGISKLLHEIASGSEQVIKKDEEAARWREAHRYTRLSKRLYGMLQALARQN